MYEDQINSYLDQLMGPRWSEMVNEAMAILQEESRLEEIVQLVGMGLSLSERSFDDDNGSFFTSRLSAAECF